MKVGFVTNSYGTEFYAEVSRRLAAYGVESIWMSTSHHWAMWLRTKGVCPDAIFDATKYRQQWEESSSTIHPDMELLHRMERAAGYTYNDLHLGGRLWWRKREAEYGRRYASVIAHEVGRFLDQHDVAVIFGELTWAFELIIDQVCRLTGRSYLRPQWLRQPRDRFTFFDGRLEYSMMENRAPLDEHRVAAAAAIAEFRDAPRRPSYMLRTISSLQLRPSWIRRMVSHLFAVAGDPHDETSKRPLPLLIDHARRNLRQHTNRYRGRFDTAGAHRKRPFVLFTMHVQPESSIDVMASPYCNQVEIVRAMARGLPVTHDLLVRENRIGLQYQNPRIYEELRAIPGVKLIEPFSSNFDYIRNADMVVTIAGTAAFEAALLGVPSAVIAPIYFEPIVALPRFQPFAMKLLDVLPYAPSRVASDDALTEFMARLFANSYPGRPGESLWAPESMEPANIDRVTAGFHDMLQRHYPSTVVR